MRTISKEEKIFGELHRFINKGGEKYSAIYINKDEILSCPREKEKGMIEYFELMRNGYVIIEK